MGDVTAIAWTDRTYNHWIGCTKVGPGCEHCYAEAWDERFNAGVHWGPGAPRRLTAPANRSKPFRWDREAEATGKRWVFCSSLSDVFDNEVDPQWRTDLWAIIRQCRNLRWQITTKRIGNALKMLPRDWPEAFPHVGFLATVVTNDELFRDADKIMAVKAKGAAWVGLSIEPQLSWIDLSPVVGMVHHHPDNDRSSPALKALIRAARAKMGPMLDWVICGGESQQGSHQARPFDIQWARSLHEQCGNMGVPFFMKQLGSRPIEKRRPTTDVDPAVVREIKLRDRAGADPSEWPADLRVREMPTVFGDQP